MGKGGHWASHCHRHLRGRLHSQQKGKHARPSHLREVSASPTPGLGIQLTPPAWLGLAWHSPSSCLCPYVHLQHVHSSLNPNGVSQRRASLAPRKDQRYFVLFHLRTPGWLPFHFFLFCTQIPRVIKALNVVYSVPSRHAQAGIPSGDQSQGLQPERCPTAVRCMASELGTQQPQQLSHCSLRVKSCTAGRLPLGTVGQRVTALFPTVKCGCVPALRSCVVTPAVGSACGDRTPPT